MVLWEGEITDMLFFSVHLWKYSEEIDREGEKIIQGKRGNPYALQFIREFEFWRGGLGGGGGIMIHEEIHFPR